MQIKTRCPQCLTMFKSDNRFIAQPTTCRTCGGRFEIREVRDVVRVQESCQRAEILDGSGASAKATNPAQPAVTLSAQQPASPGDRGPLSEGELDQLKETESWRRKMRVASVLCRILCWLAVVYGVAYFFISAALMSNSRGAEDRMGAVLLLFVAVISCGMAVLSHLAADANRRCRRWAPMTMYVLELIGAIFALIMGIVLAFEGGAIAFMVIWTSGILPAVLAGMFYRSWSAMPEYLAQPPWCRHALEFCGL